MLFNKTGPKFVDHIKSHVAKINSQSEREIPTDTAIITVAKEGIRLQHPMLYQVLEIMPYLSLDKLNKQISQQTVSLEEPKGGGVSNSLVPKNSCWNCKSTDHPAKQCPTLLSAKVRDMNEENDHRRALYKQKSRQVTSPSKYFGDTM